MLDSLFVAAGYLGQGVNLAYLVLGVAVGIMFGSIPGLGGATAIAFRYRSGVALADAIQEMLDEVKRLGGDAGVIAVTNAAEIAMPYNSEGMKRACVSTATPLTVATFT